MEKTSYTPGFLPRDIERADGDSLLSNFWKSQSVSPQEDSPRRETEQEMRRLPLSAEAAVPSCQRFLKLHSRLHPTHSPHHRRRFCKPGGATLFPALQGCPPVVDKLHSLSLPCTAPGAYPPHSVSLTAVPPCCPWAPPDLGMVSGFALSTASHLFLMSSVSLYVILKVTPPERPSLPILPKIYLAFFSL